MLLTILLLPCANATRSLRKRADDPSRDAIRRGRDCRARARGEADALGGRAAPARPRQWSRARAAVQRETRSAHHRLLPQVSAALRRRVGRHADQAGAVAAVQAMGPVWVAARRWLAAIPRLVR